MRSCYPYCAGGGCAGNCPPVKFRQVYRKIQAQRLIDQCTDCQPIERTVSIPVSTFPGLSVGDPLNCKLNNSIEYQDVTYPNNSRRTDKCTNPVVDLIFNLTFKLSPPGCDCNPDTYLVPVTVARSIALCVAPAAIIDASQSSLINCFAVVSAVNDTNYTILLYIVPCFVISSIVNENICITGFQPVDENSALPPCCQKLNCAALDSVYGCGNFGYNTTANSDGTVNVSSMPMITTTTTR